MENYKEEMRSYLSMDGKPMGPDSSVHHDDTFSDTLGGGHANPGYTHRDYSTSTPSSQIPNGSYDSHTRAESEATEEKKGIENDHSPNSGVSGMLYKVDDTPPWHTCIILGLQHCLTVFGGVYALPFILKEHLCMSEDVVGLSELISTFFFVCGLCTLIQTVFGARLPIIQGGSFAYVAPAIAILSMEKWDCPYENIPKEQWANHSLPEIGSDDHREMWQQRMRELQGCIILASLFQVFAGAFGLIGLVLRFMTPLVVAPTISLIGLSLFNVASDKASKHWWVALLTVFLVTLFSQYLRDVPLPLPAYNRKKMKFFIMKFPIFKLFPVLLAMALSWVICVILTETDVLPNDPKNWQYAARTDANTDVLAKAKWFRVPYPGQWGIPTFSVAGVFGILSGVIATTVESIGDFYACARLSGAPPPPPHALNRGIAVEGIGCLFAGIWGTGNGITSYSENIGAIGITKVGSRLVVMAAGTILIVLGCLGKVGAVFVTLPEPVLGGIVTVMFGMVLAIGMSNLQFVDMNSTRNLFVFGISIFIGLMVPFWVAENKDLVRLGNSTLDQIIFVLLSSSMFVGGMLAFLLDNTIPGTREERGIDKWNAVETGELAKERLKVYDLPYIQKYLDRMACTRYIPVCPGFMSRGDRE